MTSQHIAIGCDHAGFPYKHPIIEMLQSSGFEVHDFGTHSIDSVDYPDFVHPVANAVETESMRGVLLCGSANGVAMTANKHAGVRAAICWSKEIAELARLHNDANTICIPVRYTAEPQALEMVKLFLATAFEGGRHQRRVDKIAMTQNG